MEPVKGGSLANLPEKAAELLQGIHPEARIASWVIRFTTELSAVEIVLSGMNTMEQMADNIREFLPLCEAERNALHQVAEIIRSSTATPCIGCNYCGPNCPMKFSIPKYFALYNDYARYPGEDWKIQNVYDNLSETGGKLSDCINCKRCGIDSKTVRRLKANDNIETKTLNKLCVVLDCRLEDIAEYIKD